MKRYSLTCPSCGQGGHVPGHFLGHRVTCRRCAHTFLAPGENVEDSAADLLLNAEEKQPAPPDDDEISL